MKISHSKKLEFPIVLLRIFSYVLKKILGFRVFFLIHLSQQPVIGIVTPTIWIHNGKYIPNSARMPAKYTQIG